MEVHAGAVTSYRRISQNNQGVQLKSKSQRSNSQTNPVQARFTQRKENQETLGPRIGKKKKNTQVCVSSQAGREGWGEAGCGPEGAEQVWAGEEPENSSHCAPRTCPPNPTLPSHAAPDLLVEYASVLQPNSTAPSSGFKAAYASH